VGLHHAIAKDHQDDMTALTVDVLGTAVAIAAPAPLLTELRMVLADLEPAPSADRELTLAPTNRGFDLHDDGRTIRRGVDPDIAAATVVWRLNAIAGESATHVLLHGACVVDPLGGAVLLPGGTGAGKSTLTAACVTAGLTYLSDELAAIDGGAGTITPYTKPLALDGERLVPASSLGPVASMPVAPAALVFPRYDPGARLDEVRLDSAWALLALAAHATNLRLLGGPALAWLAGLALACPARQLTHGDANEAVAAVERAAAGPGRRVEPAEVLDPITEDTTTVAMGDALAVLHEPSGKIHVLNRAAAAVWRRAACALDGSNISSLLDAVVDAADGEHPDRSATAATVDRLLRSGLLVAPAAT